MALEVRVIHVHADSRIEDFARQRLDLVVGRFDERLSSIDVHIRTEGTPKTNQDQTCSIDARLVPRGTIHVHATATDVYEAILKAIHRLETVVAKAVDRGHRGKAVRHARGRMRGDHPTFVDRSETLTDQESASR